MIPRRPRPLCAICADREATTITDWECESGATRTIVACWPCLSPVPDPPEVIDPLLVAVGDEERTFAEIVARFGIDDLDRTGAAGALRKRLQRLEQAGLVASRPIDPRNHRRGHLFRRTDAIDPIASLLADLPREFTARDLGRSPTEASSIIRSLAHRGLIECVARLRQRTVAGVRTSEPAVWRRIEMEDSHAA